MKQLKTYYHSEVTTLEDKAIFKRLASRCITLQGEEILLMYTARYDDYSLPGGGLDEGEDFLEGMIRELSEETGANNVQDVQPFGIYEEYRPWHKPDFDIVHMISYCYTCNVDKELGESALESYEVKNGMEAKWINIYDAIKHNKNTMATSDKKGMSVERETFLLELIVERLF